MKFYIGISGGKVLGNWGGDTELSREEARLLCGLGKADALEMREIQTPEGVPTGYPLALYDANWQRKTPAQLAAEGLDENGAKLPTAAEIQAKADKETKVAKQKRKVELLQKLVALNDNYEANALVPIAGQVAASKRDIAKTIRQQRIELEKAKADILVKLRGADAKAVAKAKTNATKYKALLQSAEKELAKLES